MNITVVSTFAFVMTLAFAPGCRQPVAVSSKVEISERNVVVRGEQVLVTSQFEIAGRKSYVLVVSDSRYVYLVDTAKLRGQLPSEAGALLTLRGYWQEPNSAERLYLLAHQPAKQQNQSGLPSDDVGEDGVVLNTPMVSDVQLRTDAKFVLETVEEHRAKRVDTILEAPRE